MKIKPGTRFPFAVALADESLLGAGHTWASVADWCFGREGDVVLSRMVWG